MQGPRLANIILNKKNHIGGFTQSDVQVATTLQ